MTGNSENEKIDGDALVKRSMNTVAVVFDSNAIGTKDLLRKVSEQIAELGPETEQMLREFATALRAKLAAAEAKYGRRDDWKHDDWEKECREQMRAHIEKGDPLDVAAYCAFMWARGWSTA